MKKNHKCRNDYRKPFCSITTQWKNSYSKYRRHNDGQKIRIRGVDLDNRWVVPYNPYLLTKFNCRINAEICSTIKAAEYLYKYIYKGHDRVAFIISCEESSENIDKIKYFQIARWISQPKAMWRI